LEVVVVDDGSTSDNAELNQWACQELAGCQYLRLPSSLGACAARNHGLRLSLGAYLWFLDDDDYATDRTVADVLDAVSAGTDSKVLLMPRTVILHQTAIAHDVPVDEPEKLERYRQSGIEVTTSCAIWPRSVLGRLNGWDETLPALQDTDLFLRAATIAEFGYLATEPVRVDTSALDRITHSFVDGQMGKMRFLHKHWHLLSVRRRLRYLMQIAICTPLFRAMRLKRRIRRAAAAGAPRPSRPARMGLTNAISWLKRRPPTRLPCPGE
jgi:hypothetical protein